jgi:hypothetical protein
LDGSLFRLIAINGLEFLGQDGEQFFATLDSIWGEYQSVLVGSLGETADAADETKNILEDAIPVPTKGADTSAAKAAGKEAGEAVNEGVDSSPPAEKSVDLDPDLAQIVEASKEAQAALDAAPPLEKEFILKPGEGAFGPDGKPLKIPTGAPNSFAAGGSVRGPGTSTSDSILAALSTGEYVMDAKTTKAFGPDFFRALQNMSRMGYIPRFAVGGAVGRIPVFSGINPAGLGDASRDVVDVNLNVQGTSFRLNGDRAEVDSLRRSLTALSRGNAR